MMSAGGAVRFLYNHFLKVNQDQYQSDKTFVWYADMCSQLTALKKQHTWLRDTYSQSLQQSLKDLDTALKNIKKTGAGFPRFKSKYTTPVSFRYQQHTHISEDQRYLHLPKIGEVKIKLHRPLPAFTGVTITQTPHGWYVSFVVDVCEKPLVLDVANPVGVDVNSQYTALSTGELVENPRPLRVKLHHVKQNQRRLSRTQKKSKNRQKQKLRLARIHDRIRGRRLNHIHQLSARITKAHDLVCTETLNIEAMKRKSKPVAKAVTDAGWAQFISACAYKCTRSGHHFMKINQWLPSSRSCNSCGVKKHKLALNNRQFDCDACDVSQHRDINAALNIRSWGCGEWQLYHSGQELSDAPVDVMAQLLQQNWGSTDASTMKQEAVVL
jgi:putative transposase